VSEPRNKGGRKTKADELELHGEASAFVGQLAALDLHTERGLAKLALEAAFGHVRGLLSEPQCSSLQKGAGIALKAIRQEKQDSEVARLEAAVAELKRLKEDAHAESLRARARAQ
jgi:hypothetical protein